MIALEALYERRTFLARKRLISDGHRQSRQFEFAGDTPVATLRLP